MIIIATILLLAALAYKVIHDYKLWLKERSINHKKEWWRWLITAATCTPSIVLFTISSNISWYLAIPLSSSICAFFIWLFFDGLYNILRGYSFWFTGTDDKEDASTDDFLQSIPKWAHLTIKIVPLVILTLIYIYYGIT